jgi:radical SAM superfamily enzyme YgiQ (UPF0313 family)
MLTLINTNRMTPLVGPIGLDYVAASAKKAGIDVELLDLGLTDNPEEAVREYFSEKNPELIGLTFRNADDCFWPSADWFVPGLKETVKNIRSVIESPIVLGGIGFSIFAGEIFKDIDADFGICGDGEIAIVALVNQLRGSRKFSDVPGLLWRENDIINQNPPSWPEEISLGTSRDFIDNSYYFKRGGQCGLETKRGCNRKCIYCADPLAKGTKLRLRNPSEVADEVQSLLSQGIDVLHICDSEFNVPRGHAFTVCEEFNRRSLGDKVRWYTYMSPSPFDTALAKEMSKAGCAGIDFTGDSACESMLKTYRQRHSRDDLAKAVKLCRENNIAVMIDLLLGGPGETPETVRGTIEFIKEINPDCAGATLGIRVYPCTAMEKIVTEEIRGGNDAAIRRKYTGPLNLLKPTFYISYALGEKSAELVKDLINGDQRFFEPAGEDSADYNYNDNSPLTQAIENGARGAYWHILHRLRVN